MQYLTNYTFDEIEIGQQSSLEHTLTERDIIMFAEVSGDINPIHLDPEFAKQTYFGKVIAHGMWAGIFVSTILGTQLPGPGTIYLEQNFRFRRPVEMGDTLKVTLTVTGKEPEKKQIRFDSTIVNQHGVTVVLGNTLVIAPTEKLKVLRPVLPKITIEEG